MADAVIANWDGHDYQARFFWIHASGLRDPEKAHVVEVSYEADGPKGFDDVVVRYDPGLEARRSFRVRHAHHQIKYHVNQSGRFGYTDLIEPEFIGAEKVSILQRLRDAVRKSAPGSTFTLVTTDRIFDNDPLNKLIRKSDNSLDVDKLFDGTTDRSAMGKIRKLWREHLGLSSDEELREIVDTFHLIDSYYSLEAMRENVDLYFKLVGLSAGGNTLEFKFDGAARKLKATQRNVLTREAFDELCLEQGWIRATQPEDRKNIAVRSFSDGPTDYLDASPENTLSLLHLFDDRHLQAGADWNAEVRPAIEEFLVRVRQTDKNIRLFLNSHSSIAFLAGALLGFKTTTHVELNQKGRGPTSVWRSDDGKTGPPATTELHEINGGEEIAVVISLSRNAFPDVVDYANSRLPSVGRLLHVVAVNGAGQQSLAGGQHAADLADQIAEALKAARPKFGSRRPGKRTPLAKALRPKVSNSGAERRRQEDRLLRTADESCRAGANGQVRLAHGQVRLRSRLPFVPPILEVVTDRLAGHARIACLGPWSCHKGGEWSLPVRARHEVEPTAGVPSETAWFVVYEPGSNDVTVYPAKVGGISLTFQHQTLNDDGPVDCPWRLGNPCLHRPAATFGRQSWNGEPDAADEKIAWYLERLLLWIDAAATGALVLDGDPFELPWRPGAASFPVVGFVGADDDLAFWKQRRSDWGWADIAKLPMARSTYAIRRFRDRQSATIRQLGWGHFISSAPVTHTAIWISLDRLPVLPPWHLPRTWAELSSLVNLSGIDLPTIFEEAGAERRRRTAHGGEHLLILGFPIADRVGLIPSRHHWLAVGSVELSDRKTRKDGFRANEATRRLLDRARPTAKTRLKWLRTASWEPEELRSRSGGSRNLSSMRVLIIGAGALGSAIAENLVRMEMTEMGVVDEDILDVGNLTRHALSLDAVGHGKAEALARALSASMPDARVEGLGFGFPPTDPRLIERLRAYDVVIDCTASDRVLDTMARFDWGGEKIFISLAMTWQAEGLLVFTASENSFPAIDAKERFSKMNVPPADVDGAPMEGIGCWHAVFPATAADVGLWAAIASKEVMKSVENPRRSCVYFQQMPDGAIVRHDG